MTSKHDFLCSTFPFWIYLLCYAGCGGGEDAEDARDADDRDPSSDISDIDGDDRVSPDTSGDDVSADDVEMEELPVSTWVSTYDYLQWDDCHHVFQARDGGFIVSGRTGARSDDYRAWILKLGPDGDLQWQKIAATGDTSSHFFISILQTSDQQYVASGFIWPAPGGGNDALVAKLDENVEPVWIKSYGGAGEDWAYAIEQTSEDGYIAVGRTASFGAGGNDLWIFRLDQDGNVQWEKMFGQSDYDDYGYSVRQTADGGYIVAGVTASVRGADEESWILKLDAGGDVEWQRTYGDVLDDAAFGIEQTPDNGYIVAGKTGTAVDALTNIWILKLEPDGAVAWQKSYGRAGYNQEGRSIGQTTDGSYIVAGFTDTNGYGTYDSLILKVDTTGNIIWQKVFGTGDDDVLAEILQTSDGGYIAAGRTSETATNENDVLILKVDGSGNVSPYCSLDKLVDPPLVAVDGTAAPGEISVPAQTTNATVSDIDMYFLDSLAVAEKHCDG